MRVGIGFDLHRLGAERPLVLGGIEIPGGPGLIGHSDADCVLHAIIDALLGAAGGGLDIGALYPDTDPRHKDADSARLLQGALTRQQPSLDAPLAPHAAHRVGHGGFGVAHRHQDGHLRVGIIARAHTYGV